MADCFLREVKRMHQLRVDINEMTPEEVDALIRGLGDDAAEDWVFAAGAGTSGAGGVRRWRALKHRAAAVAAEPPRQCQRW